MTQVDGLRGRYDARLEQARASFAARPAISAIFDEDVDPSRLQLFLINYCSYGVQLMRPVEGWIRRAGARCDELGLGEIARALRAHAASKAGMDELLVSDTFSLVDRWNHTRTARLDASRLMARPAPAGVQRYVRLHEETISGEHPYGRIAIEHEVETLSVRYAGLVARRCVEVLGASVLQCLSFLGEQLELGAEYSTFDSNLMSRLFSLKADSLGAMVSCGEEAIAAYSSFVDDCLLEADRFARVHEAEILPPSDRGVRRPDAAGVATSLVQ